MLSGNNAKRRLSVRTRCHVGGHGLPIALGDPRAGHQRRAFDAPFDVPPIVSGRSRYGTSTTSKLVSIFAVFSSIAVAEQYLPYDSATARSTAAAGTARPVTTKCMPI